MKRVGVFGGTFDPPHLGHLALALAALEELQLAEVLFVPGRRSPLKEVGPIASDADRFEMVTAAIADEPRFRASRVALDGDTPSFTVDLLEDLKGSGELFLIVGADAAVDFPKWRRPDRILELATLAIAARPGFQTPHPDERAVVFNAPQLDISSSEVRNRATAGRSLRYLVPDAVAQVIRDRASYSPKESGPRTT